LVVVVVVVGECGDTRESAMERGLEANARKPFLFTDE